MTVPGSNLLAAASKLIRFQRVFWYAYADRSEDELGRWVTSYNDPAVIRGSWQPVDRTRYEREGLDLSKSYARFYTPAAVRGVESGRASDIIEYRGRRYEVVSVEPWNDQDGWCALLLVDVGGVPEPGRVRA